MIPADVLEIVRGQRPTIVGSYLANPAEAADVDIMILWQSGIEKTIESAGFVRQTPRRNTTNPLLMGAWKRGKVDIHVADAEGYRRNKMIYTALLKSGAYGKLSKTERYRLIRKLIESR